MEGRVQAPLLNLPLRPVVSGGQPGVQYNLSRNQVQGKKIQRRMLLETELRSSLFYVYLFFVYLFVFPGGYLWKRLVI